MKIKMLQTRRGTEDGFKVRQFEKDGQYDVSDSLGRAFINGGWAIKAEGCQLMTERYCAIVTGTRFNSICIGVKSVTIHCLGETHELRAEDVEKITIIKKQVKE